MMSTQLFGQYRYYILNIDRDCALGYNLELQSSYPG